MVVGLSLFFAMTVGFSLPGSELTCLSAVPDLVLFGGTYGL